MAITTTFDTTLSRVRVTGTLLGATAVTVTVTRTTDNFATSTVVRGGWRKPMSGQGFSIDDYEFPPGVPVRYRAVSYNNLGQVLADQSSVATTFTISDVWLKVPAAPYLNRAITVSEAGDISRPSRNQVFEPIGRNYPVVVSDVRSSIQFDLKIRTFTLDQEKTLDYVLGSGEIVFVHVPLGNNCMRGGYYSVGDVTWGPPGSRARPERIFVLPLREVAPPGPDVVGSSYTWQSVLNDYATWTAVLAGNASWAVLMDRVGDPIDIVVA